MYIPSSHRPRFVGVDLHVHQKRQTDSDNLIPHVDNKVALMVGGESNSSPNLRDVRKSV